MAKKSASGEVNKSESIRTFLAANPGLGAKAVKDALAASGVDVSVGLVNKIKYAKPASGSTAAGSPKASKATSRKAGRPQAGGDNLSELIRDYIRQNPTATRPEIRSGLQAAGHDVKVSLVNAVFVRYYSNLGMPMPTARPGRATAAPKAAIPKARAGRKPAASSTRATAVGGALDASVLLDAKSVVDRLGGINKVRTALELLEKLA